MMSESNEFEEFAGLRRPPGPEPVSAESREGEEHGGHPEPHHPHHFRMLRVEGDELVEVKPDEIKTFDREEDIPPPEEPDHGHHGHGERP